MVGDLSGALNRDGLDITRSRIPADALAGMLTRIHDQTISGKIAKQVFDIMWSEDKGADELIEAKGLKQITDTSAIETMVDEIIAISPQQVEQYLAGKQKLLGYFVGQVMKATRGQANPKLVNELLREKLRSDN